MRHYRATLTRSWHSTCTHRFLTRLRLSMTAPAPRSTGGEAWPGRWGAGDRRTVERLGGRTEVGAVGDLRGVAAGVVAADHSDDRPSTGPGHEHGSAARPAHEGVAGDARERARVGLVVAVPPGGPAPAL